MRLGVPKETAEGERRVALVPEVVRKLAAAGHEIVVEAGAGARRLIPDALFEDAGARIGDPWDAEVVAKVAPPSAEEVARLGRGSILVGFLAPLTRPDVIRALAERRDRAGDGGHPADLPRPVDGRALLAVQRRAATRRRCSAPSTPPASTRCS